MLIPIVFFMRRTVLVMVIIFLNELFLSLALLQAISVFYLGFFMSKMPLVTRRANLVEVFNELCMCLILYSLTHLTNFLPEASSRYSIGYLYIFFTGGNMLVHLVIMVALGIKGCIFRIKVRKRKQVEKKVEAKHLE